MKTYKDMREEMGLTQAQVADALGISRPYYSFIECYKRNFSLNKAIDFFNLYAKKTGNEIDFLHEVKYC